MSHPLCQSAESHSTRGVAVDHFHLQEETVTLLRWASAHGITLRIREGDEFEANVMLTESIRLAIFPACRQELIKIISTGQGEMVTSPTVATTVQIGEPGTAATDSQLIVAVTQVGV